MMVGQRVLDNYWCQLDGILILALMQQLGGVLSLAMVSRDMHETLEMLLLVRASKVEPEEWKTFGFCKFDILHQLFLALPFWINGEMGGDEIGSCCIMLISQSLQRPSEQLLSQTDVRWRVVPWCYRRRKIDDQVVVQEGAIRFAIH